MATISVIGSNLTISFTGREGRVLGRPNLKLDKSGIKTVSFESNFQAKDLGKRVSRRPLLGGLLGEYRKGEEKIVVVGNSGRGYLKISLHHPTIDQVWYFGSDAESLLALLSK